jgi:hypothetical protein
MTTQYSWEITGKKKINQVNYSDVIVQVYWSKIGTRDGQTARFDGCTSLSLEHTAPGDVVDFVDYEDVSDGLLIGWVSDFIISTEGLSDKIDADIENQLDNIAYENVWR